MEREDTEKEQEMFECPDCHRKYANKLDAIVCDCKDKNDEEDECLTIKTNKDV